jgi:hypothetical protein
MNTLKMSGRNGMQLNICLVFAALALQVMRGLKPFSNRYMLGEIQTMSV